MSDLPDVYKPTKRRNMTSKRRLKVFLEAEGKCCLCGGQIDGVRDRWIVEHLVPLADGGIDEESNMAPAHEKCAKGKTSSEAATRKRHRRAAQNHFGAKAKGGFQTNRGGKYKKLMDGTVVLRSTGEVVKERK